MKKKIFLITAIFALGIVTWAVKNPLNPPKVYAIFLPPKPTGIIIIPDKPKPPPPPPAPSCAGEGGMCNWGFNPQPCCPGLVCWGFMWNARCVAAAPPKVPTGSITCNPPKVDYPSGQCSISGDPKTPTISWSTSNASDVCVLVNGTGLWACNTSGSSNNISWFCPTTPPPNTYEFVLYANYNSNRISLGSCKVYVYYTPGTSGGCPSDSSCTEDPTCIPDPWFQTQGGDVHGNSDVGTTIVPTNTYFSLDPAGVVSTGLGFVGNIEEKMSSTGWQVEDSTGEVISGFGANRAVYDYDYFYKKLEAASAPAFTGSKPPGSGIYVANNPRETETSKWTISSTEKIVIFVNGNLTIHNEIEVAEGGFLAFIVSGDIIFDKNLGVNPQANPAATKLVEGIYLANGWIRTVPEGETANKNKKFIGKGMFIADADLDGTGGFDLRRDLEKNNFSYPAEYFEYRPDFLVNFPSVFGTRRMIWREVAP